MAQWKKARKWKRKECEKIGPVFFSVFMHFDPPSAAIEDRPAVSVI